MAPLIRSRHAETDYPIGRLIFERARHLGLSRTDVVRRFGYTNNTKGHRALSQLLRTGGVIRFVARHLAAALQVDQDLIDHVLAATEKQRDDEAAVERLAHERDYRAAFRPHLRVLTERERPEPIFLAAMIGAKRLLTVDLPDGVCSADDQFRDRLVKRAVIDHYQHRRGLVPAFGPISGYALVILAGYSGVDFGLPFDMDGNRAGPMRTVERVGEATLRVGKRATPVPSGFLRNVIVGEPPVSRQP